MAPGRRAGRSAQPDRRIVLGSRMLGVLGRIQKQDEVVHLMAKRLNDLNGP